MSFACALAVSGSPTLSSASPCLPPCRECLGQSDRHSATAAMRCSCSYALLVVVRAHAQMRRRVEGGTDTLDTVAMGDVGAGSCEMRTFAHQTRDLA